ncbi:hypothetical protein HOP61_17965 [Halomonas daqingensis]|uniref:Uncharacterized protein n=1 Tax=Billgrantia desiderata TaxID=52021 RepID=A0AAW4YX85_9GAMM|nr:hypothetical protein [Halomonas desiderata]MCE8053181.1 hypothetical protein [Halomonas desiderata]
MTHEEQALIAPAAVHGDCRFMRRISAAQGAIAAVLMDDMKGTNPLNDYHRYGLVTALELPAVELEERAAFIEEQVFTGGGQ